MLFKIYLILNSKRTVDKTTKIENTLNKLFFLTNDDIKKHKQPKPNSQNLNGEK